MERIAIVGATGLIGTSIGASSASRGFRLVKVARHVEGNALSQSGVVWKAADIGRTSRVERAVLLEGAAAVVNCAGALQDGPSDDLDATHRSGLSELIAGCRAAGVTRFIHFSAMGVVRARPSKFLATK